MKTTAPRENEKLPTLKVVKDEKTPVVELPRLKESKEIVEPAPAKYPLMPEQPKGYLKWRGNDMLL